MVTRQRMGFAASSDENTVRGCAFGTECGTPMHDHACCSEIGTARVGFRFAPPPNAIMPLPVAGELREAMSLHKVAAVCEVETYCGHA
jgi:hypothetical protein